MNLKFVFCITGVLAGVCFLGKGHGLASQETDLTDGSLVKRVLEAGQFGENLIQPEAWRPWEAGYTKQGHWFVCDNGQETNVQRGASQTILLNQTQPAPIVASVWSKAERVTGSPDTDYSLYLDLIYDDGTPLWGQTASFPTGTHDWQQRKVVVLPEKPVRQVAFHLLLRRHGGKAWFRDPQIRVVQAPEGAALFDGVPVISQAAAREGFQVRDVAAGSGFAHINRRALGLELEWSTKNEDGATFIDVTLSDTTGTDRAVTLIYTVPVSPMGLRWFRDPRRSSEVEPSREYTNTNRFRVGSNGRLSRYPFGAVGNAERGLALGIDMARPAFFRVGYNVATGELFLAYDIGLAAEKPRAKIRFCRFEFEPKWGFRAALADYYRIFPRAFRCRTPQQGLWMPFARISQVQGWGDFGFKFKEGNNETVWDDEHGIFTFRYTEPMTWWMRMPTDMPRTLEAALSEAKRLDTEKGDLRARALFTSGYHNQTGDFPARILDTPWCNGAVWSMNSMPGIAGDVTDFANKWNPTIQKNLYGARSSGDLDGEYVDSSEGYVTDELNFRRDHFRAADTPLTFSPESHKPAVFRGLVAFEYVRAIARDVHGMNKLMMANGAPTRLCWLAPMLDVLGTETNWHPGGRWAPMSDEELLYRRTMSGPKPYCFLMNTRFEDFSYELVERYMKRALAFGMFPGFFSHNASQGHYFTRPELYNRDRPLFKKYIPLCKLVAEAGWQPVTLARSDGEDVYVERFGDRYLTVLNNNPHRRDVIVRLDGKSPDQSQELVSGRSVQWHENSLRLGLDGEGLAVIDLGDDGG